MPSDKQIMQQLIRAFDVPDEVWPGMDHPTQVLDWVEDNVGGISMPFSLVKDVRVYNEKLPVENMVLKPNHSSALFRACQETEYPWMLVSSSSGTGAESLFFVRVDTTGADEMPDSQDCLRCFNRSASKWAIMLLGRRHSAMAMTLNLPAFITHTA